MKIFTLRNILGAVAIGGAYQYARKHGGVRNAFNELVGKAKELAARGEASMTTGSTARSSTLDDERTGYGTASSSGYTGSLDRTR